MTTDVREALTTIYQRRRALTPALVVDESRDPSAPLHHRFEWDDSVAGEAFREVQAAHLIRSVHVSYDTEPDRAPLRVRAFLPIPERESYLPAAEVSASAHMTALVLAQMEREWRQLRRKYQAHEEFWNLLRRDIDGQEAA